MIHRLINAAILDPLPAEGKALLDFPTGYLVVAPEYRRPSEECRAAGPAQGAGRSLDRLTEINFAPQLPSV